MLLLLLTIAINGCAKTQSELRIEYVHPEIPSSILEPCKEVQMSFETNGELLMSYISLQTAYLECASKVKSISGILNMYKDLYFNEQSDDKQ